MAEEKVIIVGGGISGLSAAYFLGQFGIESILIEKSGRLGGLIRTDSVEGCQLEAGPDSYLAAKPAVTELAEELPDLTDQIIGSNDAFRRIFVAREGRLVPLPRGMVMMVPGKWLPALRSELFSTKTKLGLLRERALAPRTRSGDISVSEFVTDHFGKEVLDYVADPLLSAVYGGDSGRLSVESVLPRFLDFERTYGSLIRGVRHERRETSTGSIFLSFRGGMQALTDALAPFVEVMHAEATQIQSEGRGWRVRTADRCLDAREVVLSCPAHAAARLLENAAPSIASELVAIPYSSAILVTMAYKKEGFGPLLDGFGFLVPRAERRTIAAATWVSTKFPSRARPDLAILRAFVVDPEATNLLNCPEQDLIQAVKAEFIRFMGIETVPVFSTVQLWPNSMPQYVVGHKQRQRNIASALDQHSGLYLVGNAYEGIGIPDCVRLAKETANRISQRRIV